MNFLFGNPVEYNDDGTVKFFKSIIYVTECKDENIYVVIHPPLPSAIYTPANQAPVDVLHKQAHYKITEINCEGVARYELIGNPFETT